MEVQQTFKARQDTEGPTDLKDVTRPIDGSDGGA